MWNKVVQTIALSLSTAGGCADPWTAAMTGRQLLPFILFLFVFYLLLCRVRFSDTCTYTFWVCLLPFSVLRLITLAMAVLGKHDFGFTVWERKAGQRVELLWRILYQGLLTSQWEAERSGQAGAWARTHKACP